jgi:hypothetical protein
MLEVLMLSQSRIYVYSLILAFTTIHISAAQEYQKELFLDFPARYADQDRDQIPGRQEGLGIDQDDNLVINCGNRLSCYNQDGRIFRDIYFYDDDGAIFGAGTDFCFDDEGNIFTLAESNRVIFINNFSPDGFLLNQMGSDRFPAINYYTRNPEETQDRYPGRLIGYVSGYGLMLFSHNFDHWPVQFAEGTHPGFPQLDRAVDHMPLAGDLRIMTQRTGQAAIQVNLFRNEKKVGSFTLKGHTILNVKPVFSLDPDHQYYFINSMDEKTNDFYEEILKYDGEELTFSTGRIPRSNVEPGKGKRVVVDRKGNIYYFHVEGNDLNIYRWILK